MKTLKHRRKRIGDFTSVTVFLSSDLLAVTSAFCMAYVTRFYLLPTHLIREIPDLRRYLQALPVVTLIFILTFRYFKIYIFDNLRRRIDEVMTVVKSTTAAAVLLMAVTFFYRDFSYSRIALVIHCLYVIGFVCLFRHLSYAIDGWLRSSMGTKTRVLIFGTNRSAKQIISRIKQSYRNRYEVVGVLAGGKLSADKRFEGIPVVGTLDDAFQQMDATACDEVILTVTDFPNAKLTDLFLKCENELITFLKMPDLFGIFTSGVDVQYIDNVPLIGIKKSPLDKMNARFTKRFCDIVLSGVGLVILSPLFLILAILVKCSDEGPVFYKQRRTGMDGRAFRIYKFRTMKRNAEAVTGPIWAIRDDERTTPIGKTLRKSNLDEIPQLWNVLKGEMSLVGPRPERPHFVGKFRQKIPRYMARHKIKAGITGWAQVNGLRGNTSVEERTNYDLYYYENWSLALDIKILFMTLFSFKNAY